MSATLEHRLTRVLRFWRMRDAVVQTLLYISNNVTDPEHADQIQAEVDGLLGRLGVK